MPNNQAAVELIGIRKSFGGFRALDDVDFTARYGEVHALLGENGAGKSSLMNVVAGLYGPEAGTINIDGQAVSFSGPRDAVNHGIGMIHQHFKLVNRFTVLENVLLALSATDRKASSATVVTRIREIAARLHSDVDVARVVGTMSIAERQRVEIIKALALGSRILILDEPTAVLTEKEAASLYEVMREIAAAGTCVIIVTHKLRDVRAVARQATIMRQGRVVATVDPATTDASQLTLMTVGSEVPAPRRSTKPSGNAVLDVEKLSSQGGGRVNLRDVSFQVRAGEIYGIAGVGGNGQTELVDALSGVCDIESGHVHIDAKPGRVETTRLDPGALLKLGFAWVPADRQSDALATRLSVQDNYAVAHLGRSIGSWAWTNAASIRSLAAQAVENANVQGVRSLDQRVGLLSGGNAQKLVVERELSRKPGIIVAHSPCRGLDVRAAAAVQQRLLEARDQGIAVLLISEDLDEVLAIADRIGVMTAGTIMAEFTAPASRQAIGEAMVNHM